MNYDPDLLQEDGTYSSPSQADEFGCALVLIQGIFDFFTIFIYLSYKNTDACDDDIEYHLNLQEGILRTLEIVVSTFLMANGVNDNLSFGDISVVVLIFLLAID